MTLAPVVAYLTQYSPHHSRSLLVWVLSSVLYGEQPERTKADIIETFLNLTLVMMVELTEFVAFNGVDPFPDDVEVPLNDFTADNDAEGPGALEIFVDAPTTLIFFAGGEDRDGSESALIFNRLVTRLARFSLAGASSSEELTASQ